MKTNHIAIITLSVIIILILTGCTKEADRDFPRVRTLAVTDITPDGVTINAEILNPEDVDITECGFIIYNGIPSKHTFIGSISCDYNKNKGMFKKTLRTGLEEGAEYYYTAYAVAGPVTTIGNTCSYTSKGSKASIVIDYYPASGQVLDTISIQLNDFIGGISGYEVYFNSIEADIIGFNDKDLKVLVPSSLTAKETTVIVQTADGIKEFDKKFSLLSPSIISFTPDEVNPGEIVTIIGSNFHRISKYNIVKFNNTTANVITSSFTEIQVAAPPLENQECTISVAVSGQTAIAENTIMILEILFIWKQVADFPEGYAYKVGAFTIGDYGYAGLGTRLHHDHIDKFWRYDPISDSWNQIAPPPGGAE